MSFLMTYSVLLYKFFQFSLFLAKSLDHYEYHVSFQDNEPQLHENILHYFLRYNFI